MSDFLARCGLVLEEDFGAVDYRARYFGRAASHMRGYEFYRFAIAHVPARHGARDPRVIRASGNPAFVTTRPAGAADVGWLADVFLRALREAITAARGAWDEARERLQFHEQLDLGRTRVIQLRGADIGFLMSLELGNEVELHTLCVAPEYQSQGIGSSITRGLVGDARASGRSVVLSVLKANERARRFYERLGFVIVNESTYHHRMRFREPAA